MFTIWFSGNCNILSFGAGSSGPVFFSLGIRDSLLVLLVVNIMCVSHWQKFQNAFISLLDHASYRLICAFSNFTETDCYSKNTSFPTWTYLFGNLFPYLAVFSAVFGPKLGMRAMVQCRFSWGYVQTFFIYWYAIVESHNSNSEFFYKPPSLGILTSVSESLINIYILDTMLLRSQVS